MLQDAVVTTTYNEWQYDVLSLKHGVTLDAKMGSIFDHQASASKTHASEEQGSSPSKRRSSRVVTSEEKVPRKRSVSTRQEGEKQPSRKQEDRGKSEGKKHRTSKEVAEKQAGELEEGELREPKPHRDIIVVDIHEQGTPAKIVPQKDRDNRGKDTNSAREHQDSKQGSRAKAGSSREGMKYKEYYR